MTTLADYKAALQTHGFDNQSATSQTSAINSARGDVQNAHRWRVLDAALSASYSLTFNVATVAIPLEVDAVRVVDGTEGWDLDYMLPQDLESLLTSDPTPAPPESWTKVGGTLYVYPVPDKAYSLRVDTSGDIADLVNDTDADVLPPFTKNAVVFGAASVLAGRQRDWGAVNYWEQKFTNRLMAAVARDNRTPREGSDQVHSGYWGESQWPR